MNEQMHKERIKIEGLKGKRGLIKDYILITIGVLFVTIGVYFFKFPNNFATGGVTGLAMILSDAFSFKISAATIVLILNVILLIVGYIFLGKKFGNRTLYGSLLFSLSLSALEILVPMQGPITQEPLLELAFAVMFPALGSAILFNIGASTGGTDVVAMLLKKYTHLDIGKSLLITDFLLTVAGFTVFSVTTVLMSLLGLLIKSTLVDSIIESINLNKYFTIITKYPKEICDYITKNIHRSATVMDGKGAFTGEDRKIILTVMSRSQAVQLRTYVKEVDPEAFILITSTSEIIGRGFRD